MGRECLEAEHAPPTGLALSSYPELAPVAIVQLQDVAFHLHRGQRWLLPGQGGAVVVGAALLQLQDGRGRHWGRD